MAPSAEPEIRRCSLTSSLLQLKCLGQDLENLDFMDKPDLENSQCHSTKLYLALLIIVTVISALKTLWILGALDNSKALTKVGRDMAAFPLEPNHARAILASKDEGCTSEVLDIVSVLSASSKLFFDTTDQRDAATETRRKFRHASGDHLTILNAVRAYRDIAAVESKGGCKDWCKQQFVNQRTLREASEIRAQLQTTCERMNIDWHVSCGDREEPVLKSLFHGLVQNGAFLQPDGSYRQVMGHSVSLLRLSGMWLGSRLSRRLSKSIPGLRYATRNLRQLSTMSWSDFLPAYLTIRAYR